MAPPQVDLSQKQPLEDVKKLPVLTTSAPVVVEAGPPATVVRGVLGRERCIKLVITVIVVVALVTGITVGTILAYRRFHHDKDCRPGTKCGDHGAIGGPPVNKCLLPKDPGPCEAAITKYYYDSAKGKCSQFTYGGCKGNGNRFDSLDDCKKACSQRPGQCPMIGCMPPLSPCRSAEQCEQDRDCPYRHKCCSGCSECKTCFEAYFPCDGVKCSTGTECIDSEGNAECVPVRPGECPMFKCATPFPETCEADCKQDNDCAEGHKCCSSCTGCKQCFKAFLPDPCAHVNCKEGEKCVLKEVQCIRAPCDPQPMCVPEGKPEGQCPKPGPDTKDVCDDQCQSDENCKEGHKCCPTSCGGSACASSIHAKTCDDVGCWAEESCREVYASNKVSPRCLVNPPRPPSEANCTVGNPMLVNSSGSLSVAFCGRGFNRMDCPEGYHCNIAADDGFAVCCRNLDKCLLPKESGPCEAAATVYYYNPTHGVCKTFMYGGCEGNDNKFSTRDDCRTACSRYICKLPKKPGMCRAYFPSYFFNTETGKCEKFVYGGCQGNDNRFDTEEECKRVCLPE